MSSTELADVQWLAPEAIWLRIATVRNQCASPNTKTGSTAAKEKTA